ncbi:hypothetical protein CEXT_690451 [Caerostris extrusa]|uniref:Uncharacterized protein n=1 Tax=Caerostris extrusa TaxID=172846 RepID=A0AAV4ML78_CAEEX|nr:hypothetical protein CEXT_690451 [Caerostris extrusa]
MSFDGSTVRSVTLFQFRVLIISVVRGQQIAFLIMCIMSYGDRATEFIGNHVWRFYFESIPLYGKKDPINFLSCRTRSFDLARQVNDSHRGMTSNLGIGMFWNSNHSLQHSVY